MDTTDSSFFYQSMNSKMPTAHLLQSDTIALWLAVRPQFEILILVETLSKGSMATLPEQHHPSVELHASRESRFWGTILCYANINGCYPLNTPVVMVKYLIIKQHTRRCMGLILSSHACAAVTPTSLAAIPG